MQINKTSLTYNSYSSTVFSCSSWSNLLDINVRDNYNLDLYYSHDNHSDYDKVYHIKIIYISSNSDLDGYKFIKRSSYVDNNYIVEYFVFVKEIKPLVEIRDEKISNILN